MANKLPRVEFDSILYTATSNEHSSQKNNERANFHNTDRTKSCQKQDTQKSLFKLTTNRHKNATNESTLFKNFCICSESILIQLFIS